MAGPKYRNHYSSETIFACKYKLCWHCSKTFTSSLCAADAAATDEYFTTSGEMPSGLLPCGRV